MRSDSLVKYGNLSQQLAPTIGVRFEHVVYNFGKVNVPGKAFIEKLLQEDCNVYLISTLSERKVRAWCYKWGVGYTKVIEAAGTLEIPEICFHNKMILYYDTDDRVLQDVGIRGNPQIKAVKWEQDLHGSATGTNH